MNTCSTNNTESSVSKNVMRVCCFVVNVCNVCYVRSNAL